MIHYSLALFLKVPSSNLTADNSIKKKTHTVEALLFHKAISYLQNMNLYVANDQESLTRCSGSEFQPLISFIRAETQLDMEYNIE